MKILILPSSFCAARQSGAHGMCHILDTPLRSTLPNLSLFMEFLGFFSVISFLKNFSRIKRW